MSANHSPDQAGFARDALVKIIGGDATIAAGTSGDVEIRMDNSVDAAGFQVDIGWDESAMSASAMTAAARMDTDFTLSHGALISGSPVTVLGFSLTGAVLDPGDETIFTVTLDVPADVAAGEYVLDVSGVTISSSEGTAISSSGTDGVISVTAD